MCIARENNFCTFELLVVILSAVSNPMDKFMILGALEFSNVYFYAELTLQTAEYSALNEDVEICRLSCMNF